MAKRKVIRIDEEKCTGCGLCIPSCPEGALQMIDRKARLISDLFCDGLGACIGECPVGAISIEEREAEPYNEKKVMENIVKQGENVIRAHLKHLKEHNQLQYLNEAIQFLKEKEVKIPDFEEKAHVHGNIHGQMACPGSRIMQLERKDTEKNQTKSVASQLRQWPIQLRLIMTRAPYYQGKDVLLVADCVAYALGSFHADFLKEKSIAIACPKLDEDQELYIEKIKSWFEDAKINTLTVLIMEVPCCMGLLNLAKEALNRSKRKIPIKLVVIGIKGEVLSEECGQ